MYYLYLGRGTTAVKRNILTRKSKKTVSKQKIKQIIKLRMKPSDIASLTLPVFSITESNERKVNERKTSTCTKLMRLQNKHHEGDQPKW